MANNSQFLHLKIITPKGVFLEDDVSELVAPGTEGDFGVQIGHTPFISSVRPGILKIYKNDKKVAENISVIPSKNTKKEAIIFLKSFS